MSPENNLPGSEEENLSGGNDTVYECSRETTTVPLQNVTFEPTNSEANNVSSHVKLSLEYLEGILNLYEIIPFERKYDDRCEEDVPYGRKGYKNLSNGQSGYPDTDEHILKDATPDVPFLLHLRAGKYVAQLTIQELLVQSRKNFSFSVESLPLKSHFLGGSVRSIEMREDGNATLYLEITSPIYAEYNIKWHCSALSVPNFHNHRNCFYDSPKKYFHKNFQYTQRPSLIVRRVSDLILESDENVFKSAYLILEYYFERCSSSYVSILNDSLRHLSNYALPSFNWSYASIETHPEQYLTQYLDEMDHPYSFLEEVMNLAANILSWIGSSIESSRNSTLVNVTFPLSLLKENITRVVFEVEVTGFKGEVVKASQMLHLITEHTDSIGIVQEFEYQIPFGVTARAVFSSTCYSCAEEGMENHVFSWSLKALKVDSATVDPLNEEMILEKSSLDQLGFLHSPCGAPDIKVSKGEMYPTISKHVNESVSNELWFMYSLLEDSLEARIIGTRDFLDIYNLNTEEISNGFHERLETYSAKNGSCSNLHAFFFEINCYDTLQVETLLKTPISPKWLVEALELIRRRNLPSRWDQGGTDRNDARSYLGKLKKSLENAFQMRSYSYPATESIILKELLSPPILEDEEASCFDVVSNLRWDDGGLSEDTLRTVSANADIMVNEPWIIRGASSTGYNQSILVIYTDRLDASYQYILNLETFNPVTDRKGKASLLLDLYPKPLLGDCSVYAIDHNNFRSSCGWKNGTSLPVKLQYSYHHLFNSARVIFYHGSLPYIDFFLPSGLKANNYTIYVTIEAVDGKGVLSNSLTVAQVVKPMYERAGGLLSMFLLTKSLVQENAAIELQKIRSLAWELNIISMMYIISGLDTIFDAIKHDVDCVKITDAITQRTQGLSLQEMEHYFKSFLKSVEQFEEDEKGTLFDLVVKGTIIKSCVRDKLVTMAVSVPTRNEMEVLMVLTALELVIDVHEYISWLTYEKVVQAMVVIRQHHLYYWNPTTNIVPQVTFQYFYLTSALLNKQYEIYDCRGVSYDVIDILIHSLFAVMGKELAARVLEEEPLRYNTNNLSFIGYLTSGRENISSFNAFVPFTISGNILPINSVYSVMSLLHSITPYALTDISINSYVLSLRITSFTFVPQYAVAMLPRSSLVTKGNYDFRKLTVLTAESIRVYTFQVKERHSHLTLQVSLEAVSVTSSALSALLLVCQDMQSLDSPIKMASLKPNEKSTNLFFSPGELPEGSYVVVVVEQNSYEKRWSERSVHGYLESTDYFLSVWWSNCFVWKKSKWISDDCKVFHSSWDAVNCKCVFRGNITIGGWSEAAITNEDLLDVNEMMLIKTFIVIYILLTVVAIYGAIFAFLIAKEKRRTRRKNLWMIDNDTKHPQSYLVTITTGTQWNAGTTSKVYAILNGTLAMSSTRELQVETSNGENNLFTRGSVCSFIWTTPESLGDCLSVQLWHDGSCPNERGWFVCEVSVADLLTGAVHVFPCYKWFSIAVQDGQMMREVNLENKTSFYEDFRHFLPQIACEHLLTMTLLSSSKPSKYYKAQRVTVFTIICLLFGTLAFILIQDVNKSHTMMTPSLHIEPLLGAFLISIVCLPASWFLNFIFKFTNDLEDRIFYKKIVEEMILEMEKRTNTDSSDSDSDDCDIYNPKAKIWRKIQRWALSMGPIDVRNKYVHPGFVKIYEETTKRELLRKRYHAKNPKNVETTNEEKNLEFISFKKRKLFYWEYFQRSLGWILSVTAALVCYSLLWSKGWGMAKDYSHLWCQTVYMTTCISIFLIQPLLVALITLYQVCTYRWFHKFNFWRVTSMETFAVDEAAAVWKYHKMQSKLNKRAKTQEEKTENLLKRRARERHLRVCHPPKEEHLLRARKKLVLKEKISSLLMHSLGFLMFLIVLSLSISYYDVSLKYYLNKALINSIKFGSCRNTSDPYYMTFNNISVVNDWFLWANSELLDLVYNTKDQNYSSMHLFCDTEHVIIGPPRVRKYQTEPVPCPEQYLHFLKINGNASSENCYPEYKGSYTFQGDVGYNTSSYDESLLSTIWGTFGWYRDTPFKYHFPNTRFGASLFLVALYKTDWLSVNGSIRALITEFTLFHTSSGQFSSVNLIAEFPTVSGAKLSIDVNSSKLHCDDYIFFFVQLFFLTSAMFFLMRTCLQLLRCRFQLWKHPWFILDFFKMIVTWVVAICSLLKVRLAEDLVWQMEKDYYLKYVNIKPFMTLNEILFIATGILMAIYLVRCLWIFKFIPFLRLISEVLVIGMKEAFKISIYVFLMCFICASLAYHSFGEDLFIFHNRVYSVLAVIQTMVFPGTFYQSFNYFGGQAVLANMFFLLVFSLWAVFVLGIYKAVFIFAKKYQRNKEMRCEITLNDIKKYILDAFIFFKNFVLKTKLPKSRTVPLTHTFSMAHISELEAVLNELSGRINLLYSAFLKKHPEEQSRAYPIWNDQQQSSPKVTNTNAAFSNSTERTRFAANSFENLEAFAEIESVPSEIGTSTKDMILDYRFNQALDDTHYSTGTDKEHMIKFFSDLSKYSSTGEPLKLEHGRYRKSVLKLKSYSDFASVKSSLPAKVKQGPVKELKGRLYKYIPPSDIKGFEEVLEEYADQLK